MGWAEDIVLDPLPADVLCSIRFDLKTANDRPTLRVLLRDGATEACVTALTPSHATSQKSEISCHGDLDIASRSDSGYKHDEK